jgi:hypothetical protein
MTIRKKLVIVALLSGAAGSFAPSVPTSAGFGPPALSVLGSQLRDQNGNTVVLHGVNRSGTEYACIQGWGVFDGPSDANSVAAIASWHTNAVRIPLNEDCWLNINGVNPAVGGANYQNAIVNYVNLLHQYGLFAILDLHWNAPGTQPATSAQPMADADHSPAFWQSVATTFRGDPAVVFDLYNEPYGIDWNCWLNGCLTSAGWQTAGMQSLVNAVRSTGATQPLMLGGLSWANDLTSWLLNKPADPVNALVASLHLYNTNACNTLACWLGVVLPVARVVPVVTGELAENDCAHTFIDTYMQWADLNGVGYLGWTWNNWAGACSTGPTLIAAFDGTPTPFGIGLRDHLVAISPLAPWMATYGVGATPKTWSPGQSQTYSVTLNNVGGQVWPAGGATPVRLGVHFSSTGGGFGTGNWYTDQRVSLPNDLGPGASVTLPITVTAPSSPIGNLVLEYQMVKEDQFWFAQFADVPVTISAPAPKWIASYGVSGTPSSWTTGQTQNYVVTVTNSGDQPWPAGGVTPVHLGVHFSSSGGGFGTGSWYTDQRVNLPNDLAPGNSATIGIAVTAPSGPTGTVVLEYEMVKEGQFWFAQFADVNVTNSAPPPPAPKWIAAYSVTNTPTSWTTNQTRTYAVTVTNAGDQIWPAGGATPAHLGVHFSNAGGGFGANTWYTDQRVSLPNDLAPGASLTLSIAVTAPTGQSGNLVLEYEMVKEGQFWFPQFADANVTVNPATNAPMRSGTGTP